jgi:hypothetical protein
MNISELMGDVLLARTETDEWEWELWAVDERPAPDVFRLLHGKDYMGSVAPLDCNKPEMEEEENE